MKLKAPVFRRLTKQRPNSLLSSASGLGLGVGFLANSVAKADDLQTIIPPQFYQQKDDGQVVLATTDGQRVIIGESQYLILEDGLLIITDELAQNTLNGVSVLGSFRSSDFSFPDPVYSSSGDIIETASDQPLWSGDRPSFQSLGIETYELAQNSGDQEGSGSSSNGTGIGNAGLGAGFGFGLMGLINGIFGSEKPEETLAESTLQEAAPTSVPTYSGPARGFVINGIDGNEKSGSSVSSAGDINNDGFDDLIIGAPNGGKSYVVFGKAAGSYSTSLELSALDGANGFVINGITGGDQSGMSVSLAGDINNDGYGDIIIGTSIPSPNGQWSGQSYVVFGKAAGSYSASLELSALDGTNGFVINGIDAEDESGFSVSSAGDVNNDGYDDIVIGAFGADPNNNEQSGESYVVFGKAEGYPGSLELSALDGNNGFVINGVDPFDKSGISVASAGDINNDGYNDIIIGAFYGDTSGEAYVVFGKASGYSASLELSSLNGTDGFVMNGINGHDNTGWSVSSAGDINNDGFDDIIIGAHQADANGGGSGKSYVVFGKAVGSYSASLELSALDGTNGFVINGVDANDFSGRSVSSAGDINNDGFDDIIIGAHQADPDPGGSYVVFGKAAGSYSASLELSALDGTNGFVINGIDAGDKCGWSVSSAGDINNDGYDDIIIGANQADSNGGDAGESYIVFGQSEFDAFVNLSDLAIME